MPGGVRGEAEDIERQKELSIHRGTRRENSWSHWGGERGKADGKSIQRTSSSTAACHVALNAFAVPFLHCN